VEAMSSLSCSEHPSKAKVIKKKIPDGVRCIIYSFLEFDNIYEKIAVLSKTDRKLLME
jgi:hypothetical protein